MTDFGGEDLFGRGDYSFWSRLFRPASESLVEAAAISVGARVLDVAAGDGNTAIAAANVGANVTAVDPSPSQIERGRHRSEGSPVQWVLALGEQLPFADGSFDHALDTFGDNLDEPTARPALEEMARVVRPGGVIGFTRWTREGFNRDWAELEERFLTGESEGSSSPLLGTEPTARAAVAPLAARVGIIRQTLSITWSAADPFTDALIAQDPYLHDLHRQLPPRRWGAFTDELRGLVHKWNSHATGLRLEFPYLRVIVNTLGGHEETFD
jgi:ubiquinone/menaquinone biosynthesis C-methylase UbiE